MFLSLCIFLIACSEDKEVEPVPPPPIMPNTVLEKDIPSEERMKNFFESRESTAYRINTPKIEKIIYKEQGLDDYANHYGFPKLRETMLPEDDLEVRIWVGFGRYGEDGLILKRTWGIWSAVNLRQMICHLEEKGRYDLSAPKSGWKALWQKLVEAEILTLPDDSKLDYESGIIDGKSYVVETNYDNLYRMYYHNNPHIEKFREAERMVKIGQVIADEFGLESFSSETASCGKGK